MPVLIAAHSSDLDTVRRVAELLREQGGEVRCYLEEDDHELRNIGCKLAVGALDDPWNLQGALINVHTFMPMFPDASNIERHLPEFQGYATAVKAAAVDSGVAQTILALAKASGGVDPTSALVRDLEESFVGKIEPVCVVRVGPGISIDELAETLVEADDREQITGIWEVPSS